MGVYIWDVFMQVYLDKRDFSPVKNATLMQ